MSVKIVLAQPHEAQAVSEIISELDTEHHHFSKLEDMQEFIDTGVAYTAKDEGNDEIKGVLIVGYAEENLEIKFIISKQKGVGRLLIEKAEELAHERNITKMWCWSLIRYNARGFYDKMGFTEQFLLKRHSFGEDCYIFGKLL